MKKTFLSTLTIAITVAALAQSEINFSIKHDKKELLKVYKEDAEKNIIKISLKDLKKKSAFTFTCSELKTDLSKGKLKRTMAIFTETDNELLRKETGSLKVPDVDLEKMLQENKIIKIYTWLLPKDPAEAARVRIRRVHLCTIELI
ncbi:MAG: hypothetical protein ABUT20_05185 [Bacteroidota bacterium]